MWAEFVEVQHLSQITEFWSSKTWEILTDWISLAFWGTLFFSVLGAWGITKNIQKIKREGAKSVPLDWEIMFLGMFVTMFPYGFERESLALVIQCFFRIPFYLVLVWHVYHDHGGATKQETLVALTMVGAIIWSIFDATLVATVLLWVGVFFAARQPWEVFINRDAEGVGIRKLIIYLGSSGAWLIYGIVNVDWYIISWSVAYGLVYICAIGLYAWAKSLDTRPQTS